MSSAAPWFMATNRGYPIQPVHTGLVYNNAGSGTLEANLPFGVPTSGDRALFICATMVDADSRRIGDIDWGVDFSLERASQYGGAGDNLYCQIWRAFVPSGQGASANLVLTLTGSGSSIDRLALTIFGTNSLDAIAAVDDGEDEGSGSVRSMPNIATTAGGFALGVSALRNGSGTVTSFQGNGSTGALIEADKSQGGGLTHTAFYGPTPATATTEDFTSGYSPSGPAATVVASYK